MPQEHKLHPLSYFLGCVDGPNDSHADAILAQLKSQISGLGIPSSLLAFRAPEHDGPIGGGGEEGLIVGVPSTLDHLIPVLSCHCLWEGLREVACG